MGSRNCPVDRMTGISLTWVDWINLFIIVIGDSLSRLTFHTDSTYSTYSTYIVSNVVQCNTLQYSVANRIV